MGYKVKKLGYELLVGYVTAWFGAETTVLDMLWNVVYIIIVLLLKLYEAVEI